MFETHLSKRMSAADIVRGWEEASAIIEQAFEDLKRAQKILDATFGDKAYMNTLPHPHHGNTVEAMQEQNKRRAWRQIINILEIKKTMSLKRIEELNKNIEEGEMPPLTIESIQQIAEGLVGSAGEFAHEAVVEVFEILRPGAKDTNRHKTNTKHARFSLGRKVILTGAVEGWSKYHVNHWHGDKIMAVDKIFHLADGQPFVGSGYQSPLIDSINTTPLRSGAGGETEYFKFTCYLNGSLHLEFKRLDLVDRLNRVAGNPTRLAGV